MLLAVFTAQHVSNVRTSIFMSLRLTVHSFRVLYCSVRIEVLALANAKTSILTEQYNTRNESTVSRKLLKMDVLTFETCWAVNGEIIERVTSSWSIFIQTHNRWVASTADRLHWILTLSDEKSKYGHNVITPLCNGRPFVCQYLRNSQLLDDDIRRSSVANFIRNGQKYRNWTKNAFTQAIKIFPIVRRLSRSSQSPSHILSRTYASSSTKIRQAV